MRYLDRMCQWQRCPGRTSVYLCSTLLQNLATPQDFCSPLSVPLEWSCWPHVRWCGTGGFQERGQCFIIALSCSIPTIVFYYFSLSLLPVYRLVLWGWGLRADRVYCNHPLSALHCRPLLIIIILTKLINRETCCVDTHINIIHIQLNFKLLYFLKEHFSLRVMEFYWTFTTFGSNQGENHFKINIRICLLL